MKLHFEGAPEIVTTRAHAWRCLMDPNFVAQSAPGVESVTTIDPTHFTVISAFGVGAIKVRFSLNVELTDVVEPDHATMRSIGAARRWKSSSSALGSLGLHASCAFAVRTSRCAESPTKWSTGAEELGSVKACTR